MYQKDFILFLAEQFGRMLGMILRRILDRNFVDARFELEQIYRQYLGVNSDLLGKLDWRTLYGMMRIDPSLALDRTVVLAAALAMEARIFAGEGVARDAALRFIKALNLLASAKLEDSESRWKEYYEQIPAIEQELQSLLPAAGLGMPEETRELLERAG